MIKLCDIGLLLGAPILDNVCGKLATKLTKIVEVEQNLPKKRTKLANELEIPKYLGNEISSIKSETYLEVEDFVQIYFSCERPVLIKGD